MRHHAIIVTGLMDYMPVTVHTAHEKARLVFPSVSAIVPSQVNGYGSFLIPPDGSKEGWEESDQGDRRRDEFIAWLESVAYDDGSHALDYAEVMFGDDNGERRIVRSDDDCWERMEANRT